MQLYSNYNGSRYPGIFLASCQIQVTVPKLCHTPAGDLGFCRHKRRATRRLLHFVTSAFHCQSPVLCLQRESRPSQGIVLPGSKNETMKLPTHENFMYIYIEGCEIPVTGTSPLSLYDTGRGMPERVYGRPASSAIHEPVLAVQHYLVHVSAENFYCPHLY